MAEERAKSIMRNILKACTGLVLTAVFVLSSLLGGSAIAAELDAGLRTIPLNDAGDTITLSVEEFTRGQRKFNQACAICHLGGITKTNPNVGLEPEALEGAYPNRNNLEALVDYLHNPTTYDTKYTFAIIMNIKNDFIFVFY